MDNWSEIAQQVEFEKRLNRLEKELDQIGKMLDKTEADKHVSNPVFVSQGIINRIERRVKKTESQTTFMNQISSEDFQYLIAKIRQLQTENEYWLEQEMKRRKRDG